MTSNAITCAFTSNAIAIYPSTLLKSVRGRERGDGWIGFTRWQSEAGQEESTGKSWGKWKKRVTIFIQSKLYCLTPVVSNNSNTFALLISTGIPISGFKKALREALCSHDFLKWRSSSPFYSYPLKKNSCTLEMIYDTPIFSPTSFPFSLPSSPPPSVNYSLILNASFFSSR